MKLENVYFDILDKTQSVHKTWYYYFCVKLFLLNCFLKIAVTIPQIILLLLNSYRFIHTYIHTKSAVVFSVYRARVLGVYGVYNNQ